MFLAIRHVGPRIPSSTHHNAVGVDADPTAGWQRVQCGGLRLRRVRGVAALLHLALDLRFGDGLLSINAPPVQHK